MGNKGVSDSQAGIMLWKIKFHNLCKPEKQTYGIETQFYPNY